MVVDVVGASEVVVEVGAPVVVDVVGAPEVVVDVGASVVGDAVVGASEVVVVVRGCGASVVDVVGYAVVKYTS